MGVPMDLNSDIQQLFDHYWLQIQQAAQGCVSGTLAEWPHLEQALLAAGRVLPKETHALELKRICQSLVEDEARRNAKFGG